MKPRTIVISLIAHVVLGALLLAIDGEPRKRLATVVNIVHPEPEEKPEEKPEPEKKPEKKPEPRKAEPDKPEPQPKKARRARVKPRAADNNASQDQGTAKPAPFFSGLVLGNADGPGLDIGVSEDAMRGPRDDAGEARAPASPKPVVQPPKVVSKPRGCTEKSRPKLKARRKSIPYPASARAAGIEGRLMLKIKVNAEGQVESVQVVSALHPDIDREAIEAARTWQFDPAQACGRAVDGTYVVARRFELTD